MISLPTPVSESHTATRSRSIPGKTEPTTEPTLPTPTLPTSIVGGAGATSPATTAKIETNGQPPNGPPTISDSSPLHPSSSQSRSQSSTSAQSLSVESGFANSTSVNLSFSPSPTYTVAPGASHPRSNGASTGTIAGVVIGTLVLLFIILFLVWLLRRRRRRLRAFHAHDPPAEQRRIVTQGGEVVLAVDSPAHSRIAQMQETMLRKYNIGTGPSGSATSIEPQTQTGLQPEDLVRQLTEMRVMMALMEARMPSGAGQVRPAEEDSHQPPPEYSTR
ncbi:hypothetical protein C8F01DRAFT_1241876 [Mycena amicta]|nr:hypothetical protein C8F01DRAFT_1241876 [Mycena amicta]